jgi:3-hydroxyanthranilate 3,4-dioxygenase
MIPPLNFKQWIDDNRDKLKPPVCNQVVYAAQDFIIMVVGGPNNRHDYHVNQTEEFFYQIEGDMLLKVVEDGQHKDLAIKQGEIFLLPANVPHSPQRFENTVGLVIERVRPHDMQDGFQWYCSQCHHKMYEEFLHISDIVEQLPPIFERFYSQHAECKQCGYRMTQDGSD